jgi:8-oxo-dGDP phosphatase
VTAPSSAATEPASLDVIEDEVAAPAFPVVSSTLQFQGRVWDVRTDEVALSADERVVRDVVLHPSAVAVLAMDDDGRVLVVRQYRHPVRAMLWELPAGLLDVAGEDPLAAAQRELWEETHHHADAWSVLIDFLTSPGMCDEALRIYLAQGVRAAVGEAFARHGEERDMQVAWVPLASLRDGILAGRLHNPTLVVGTLAALAAQAGQPADVRRADAPWPFGPRSRRGES